MFLYKANFLNQNCHCSTLDTVALPTFFSASPHFMSRQDLDTITSFIRSYENLLATPAVQQSFLQEYAAVFSQGRVEKGVFNSYDFHISAQGPRLIEINSNAGGALLSLSAAENISPCCEAMQQYLPDAESRFDREKMLQMFRHEFQLRFPQRELKNVAIVDDAPESQFFYREFLLTKELLARGGIEAYIVSPQQLEIREGRAYAAGNPVDFIYNRLTDFYFDEPASQAIREIYRTGIASVSPNPLVHALYARKSNLVSLWSDDFAASLHIARQSVANMRKIIPETIFVTGDNTESLWQGRKNWFFKPISGFGSKGVYRGDKLTKKVWQDINAGAYIAQRYIEPQVRYVSELEKFKYDIRVYTYGSEILGITARYYQGQTTNFRTPNGGLATVLIAA